MRTDSGQQTADSRSRSSRVVEGTVSSVAPGRHGDHVRLTNGMDLFVPASITPINQGRGYTVASLRPGDVVSMDVFSREGDGRDARVRSIEILQTNGRYYRNNALMSGVVVSVDRRANTLLMQTDDGRVTTVDLNTYGGGAMADNVRRGDRISVSGRMNRNGLVIANDVRVDAMRHRY